MTNVDWNLRREIRKILRDTDLASPAEIAEKVIAGLPADRILDALKVAMPQLVRVELGIQRLRASGGVGPSNRSSKVAAIRDAAPAWRAALHSRIHAGRDQWLLIAECQAGHFRFAANERRRFASGALFEAEKYDKWADACDWHGVVKFGDLPEEILKELLTSDGSDG